MVLLRSCLHPDLCLECPLDTVQPPSKPSRVQFFLTKTNWTKTSIETIALEEPIKWNMLFYLILYILNSVWKFWVRKPDGDLE